jgi:TRAP-type mannitol/chloroaromatic compound transport system substrate-binding protein
MLHTFIGLDKWNALPKAYQTIVRAACEDAGVWMTAKYDADNPKALRELVAGGTKLLPFSQAIMDASFAAANQVYEETMAKNASFKKVYESMAAFRKEEVLWFRVVENTFDNYMARQSAAGKI